MMSNRGGFYRRLRNSNKAAVRNLFAVASRSLKTVTGRSVRMLGKAGIHLGLISHEDDPLDMNIGMFRRIHRQVEVPDSERYRLNVLGDLLCLRTQFKYFEDNQFDIDEINAMIDHICVS